ncbi:MAG: serine/threonine-protein kinase [Planctomycetaceae bacterium]|nr:serine/threonine-protein kinase [Planctomycetaceae bacterium]
MSTSNSLQTDPNVDSVIVAWLEAVQRGDDSNREDFVRRYPHLESQLRQFFASYDSRQAKAPQPPSTRPDDPLTVPPDKESTILAAGDSVTTSNCYRELRHFRSGGLGTLYRGFDDSLHRETIVKFLGDKAVDDPTLVAQFQIEAEITGKLDHPGVVPVYGVGENWNGRPFYVMQLVKGQELTEAIREFHASEPWPPFHPHKRKSLLMLIEHLVDACNTVAYAHDVGIVHCDIKPANIMIGKYGETFVLDWGLAAAFERTTTFANPETSMRPRSATGSTSSGKRGGTFGYISPEQLSVNQLITPKSDVYSLGATLYHILTGAPPFNGRDPDVEAKIQAGQFVAPRTCLRRVPRALEAICLKAMSLQPYQRYATAKHLATDLNNWLRDEEVDAAPDQIVHRLARFARRHRALSAVAVVATLVVTFAIGLTARYRELAAIDKQQAQLEERLRLRSDAILTGALDTFEDLCRPLANGEMSNLAVFRPIADKIQQFTTQYLDDLEKHPTEHDRIHTGRVYELRATVGCVLSSDTTAALEYYKLAKASYEAVSRDEPGAEARAARLAHLNLSRGRLLTARKDFEEAGHVLAEAAAAIEKLCAQAPNDNGLLRELAEVNHCLGEVDLYWQKPGSVRYQRLRDSQRYFERSRDLRTMLIARSQGAELDHYNRDLARSYGYLGDLLLDQGEITQAEDNYVQSKNLRERLYKSNPKDPEHRFQYARGLGNFGTLELDFKGDLAHAIDVVQQALEIQSKLVADFEEVPTFRSDLGYYQNVLAELYLLESANHPEYVALCRQTVKAAEKTYSDLYKSSGQSSNPQGLQGLARSLVTRAALQQLESSAGAPQPANESAEVLAKRAESYLLQSTGEPLLRSADLVTLAFARSLQGEPEAALETLQNAVNSGENGYYRFERHRTVALKAVADHPQLGAELNALCESQRKSLPSE